SSFSLQESATLPALHSFPTRRSSDLSVRKLPENWEDVLAEWVKGTAFSEILDGRKATDAQRTQAFIQDGVVFRLVWAAEAVRVRSEEHTSELQSRGHLVCRLLLEKKN